MLSDGDTAWTQSANVTATADTTDKKEGTGSANLAVAVGFTTGLAAYSNLSATVDLSSIDSVKLWVKYGTTTTLGDMELVLSSDAACATNVLRTSICPY